MRKRILTILILLLLIAQGYAGEKMRVHFIDVGQGDATLLEFPNAAILIDTGSESNGSYDGAEALIGYLDDFFLERPDLGNNLLSLIITHPHIDHVRGIRAVLENYPPSNVVTNGQEKGSGRWQQRRLHRYVEGNPNDPTDNKPYCAIKLNNIPKATGLQNNVIDPIVCAGVDPKITALWGTVPNNHGWTKSHLENINNHSIALRIDFGEASVLLTGDMEEKAISDFIEQYKNTSLLDVDVYQVGHHGSENGTTKKLVQAMTPKYAVISMGQEERHLPMTAWQFGHPNVEIVKMLQKRITTTRTSTNEKVGEKSKQFKTVPITKAVYATGWDGDVVLEADHQNGSWKIIKPDDDASPTLLININTASLDKLKELPWIGPTRAQAIIDYRSNKLFQSIDELLEVKGIGPATLNKIKTLITVGE